MTNEQQLPELKLDAQSLYQEEVFTDHSVGTIRRLAPVTVDGAPDAARPTLFVGQASLLTPMGSVPLTFEIAAATLKEAVDGFQAAAQVALEQTVEEINQMRREAASSIVVPGAGGPGGAGFGSPGGGSIQMP